MFKRQLYTSLGLSIYYYFLWRLFFATRITYNIDGTVGILQLLIIFCILIVCVLNFKSYLLLVRGKLNSSMLKYLISQVVNEFFYKPLDYLAQEIVQHPLIKEGLDLLTIPVLVSLNTLKKIEVFTIVYILLPRTFWSGFLLLDVFYFEQILTFYKMFCLISITLVILSILHLLKLHCTTEVFTAKAVFLKQRTIYYQNVLEIIEAIKNVRYCKSSILLQPFTTSIYIVCWSAYIFKVCQGKFAFSTDLRLFFIKYIYYLIF